MVLIIRKIGAILGVLMSACSLSIAGVPPHLSKSKNLPKSCYGFAKALVDAYPFFSDQIKARQPVPLEVRSLLERLPGEHKRLTKRQRGYAFARIHKKLENARLESLLTELLLPLCRFHADPRDVLRPGLLAFVDSAVLGAKYLITVEAVMSFATNYRINLAEDDLGRFLALLGAELQGKSGTADDKAIQDWVEFAITWGPSVEI